MNIEVKQVNGAEERNTGKRHTHEILSGVCLKIDESVFKET